jgi:hypothetical protein
MMLVVSLQGAEGSKCSETDGGMCHIFLLYKSS